MNNQENAVKLLQAFMPTLLTVREELCLIQKKFESILYYRKFKVNVDCPSVIPITQVKEFTTVMATAKEAILNFKKTLNENDLPNDIQKKFMEIFLSLNQKTFFRKGENVYLGAHGTAAWRKNVTNIIENWEIKDRDYYPKVAYSTQAFDTISSFFGLIESIEDLYLQLS